MKQRILVVDDEPHILILFDRIISEKTDYEVETTNNSLEVLDLLVQKDYDVIITDFKMPGMDGIELLEKIKEQGRREEVIIITAFGSLESATKALSLGVFDYITKPFKKEHILFTIDRAMTLQRIRQEAKRLSEIFEREPYEQARRLFDVEYLRLLSERCGGERARMIERSGLSDEFIDSCKTD